MEEEAAAEDRKTAYVRKIAEVVNYVESANIRNADRNIFQVEKIFLNKNPFFGPLELMCDIQNIPKWWRLVLNWGSDIAFSLSWASGWGKFLEVRRKRFEAESGQSDFLSYSKSDSFDGEAWYYAKHYLDNAIFRLYSYREKIVWLLNSHAKLCFIDPIYPENSDMEMSFGNYRKAVKERPEQKALYDILSKFNSKKAKKLITYYRNEFVHNETPSVDWPKEAQATILRKYDGKGNLVSKETGWYGPQPPDFHLDIILRDAVHAWIQFLDGTNRLAEYLNETYYSKLSLEKPLASISPWIP